MSKAKATVRPSFHFEEVDVPAGRSVDFDLKVARLPAGTWARMPTAIIHGTKPGPTMWLSGAIHGDELNGIEIIRRVLGIIKAKKLSGTIIGVPIVNVFGVTIESRYLPDRRDLNRSFPGSLRGSLATQLAHLFFERVVRRCEYGIDFHTGSGGRSNLPQIRCNLDDLETRRIATTFGSQVVLHSTLRDGSLRYAAHREGVRVLLYEAGEALRFDEVAIRMGVNGTLRVLKTLGMFDIEVPEPTPTRLSRSSKWVRASRSGFCHLQAKLGDSVEKGDVLAIVTDSLGKKEVKIKSTVSGVIIGALMTSTVHRGDAVIHVGTIEP